ncbi:MAG: polyphosphate kinase 1 [Anaerolineales bacterium]|jgi:polyphosphate kinase
MTEELTPTAEKEIDLGDSQYYINRELSMLDFQSRVLAEAQDESYPILERVKFLAYVNLNLDEFYMVRVGGLRMQRDAGILKLSDDGQTPAEQLAAVRKQAAKLYKQAQDCWFEQIEPSLDEAGIHILEYSELNEKQKTNVDEYFDEVIFPVLTPLAFDPGHPFPHISNLSLNLAILIEDETGEQHFARVKVPDSLPRLVPIKRSSGGVKKDGTVAHNHYLVWLEQVICSNLDDLFPGMKVIEAHPFRVIRNADLIIQELEAADLLSTMEESVRRRRFGVVVQLAVSTNMPDHILQILTNNLKVEKNDVYDFDGPLGMAHLMDLSKIERYDLKHKQFLPYIPNRLKDTQNSDIFMAIRNGDILLHHPYDSFDPVIEFLQTAARDPQVLAIKQTLYRAGSDSPVVNALLKARREYSKQVAALVELKARFDEESNITWARKLEQEGVHVTYGLLGLKTHSKISMVIRREDDQIRRYVHLGTGNYNHVTARSYEDIGMFTCDEDIGMDGSDLFNYLTGYSAKKDFRKLLVAPINLRERMCAMIEREIEHQKNEGNGHLIFKTNAIVDKKMIKQLYKASIAGVKIDLLVRGICCLRPRLEDVSENIRVISVLGRFLEHSRIYYFLNGGHPEIYMGSADIMPRNLDDRVEILFPVQEPGIIKYLRETVLDLYLSENLRAWHMDPDGNYRHSNSDSRKKIIDPQVWLTKHANVKDEA